MVRRYLGGSKAKSWVTGSSPVSDHQLEKRKNYIFPAADELHNQLFDKLYFFWRVLLSTTYSRKHSP